jgi:sarcosine oxidase
VDVLVVGGGIVGAAAALEAAHRAPRVALVEQRRGHAAEGSSKGSARIYAPAAYPDEAHLRMGLVALERWRRIEAESGLALLRRTGALSVGEFAARQLGSLERAGVDAELISAASARRRFGVRLGDERPILFQPQAGVILAERAHRALLDLAGAAGAEVHKGDTVRSLAEEAEWVEVTTDRARWRCSAAIVAAGPWSGSLLAGAGIEVPVSVSSQSVAYLRLADPGEAPVALMEFDGDEPYALWDPDHGLKAALHARGPGVDPSRDPLEAEEGAIARLGEWVRERFPGATTGLTSTDACLYTNSPEEQFLIERRGRIAFVSACNGQGFQFAPETGARAAELALESMEVAAR